MRRHGLADSPHDLGLNGHACWTFSDLDGDFRDAAVPFLAEGQELGQRLMFVGSAEAEAVLRDLEPTRSMIGTGALGVVPFDLLYPGGRRMAFEAQWAAYAEATNQALADGFTGLRVLAEVTSLAGDGLDTLHDQAGWETYADRQMAHLPLAALCCFDRSVVPEDTLSRIASAHPVSDRRLGQHVPFHLYADADALSLAGEVDATCAAGLERLLRAGDDQESGDVVLDLGGLDFIEHVGVMTIEQHAHRLSETGRRLSLRDEPALYTRISEILGLTR
jgi:anti-anti-sigma regulatory factor